MPARNRIDLVVKTMRVLEALSEADNGANLRDIATRVGLVKSSVFRILFSLKELGYVEQQPESGRYGLTLKVLELSRRPAGRPTLAVIARPHLGRLRDQLQESAWLAERRRSAVVLTDVAEARHQLRLSFDIGDRCPLHATALGKSVAAFLPSDELEAMLGKGPLPRFTPHTLTNRAALKTELERVRKLGYAVNEEETILGAVLIGAPVFDAQGRAFAAISVSAPTPRCSPEKRRAMASAVKEAGAALSRDLGALGFHAV